MGWQDGTPVEQAPAWQQGTPVDQPKTKSEIAAKSLLNFFGPQEAILSMATGVAAEPVAGYAGMIAGALPGGKTGAEAVESVRGAMTYQPRTELGQTILEKNPLQYLEKGADWVGEKVANIGEGQKAENAWPAVGAGVKMGLAAIPMILGARIAPKGATPKTKRSIQGSKRAEERFNSIEQLREDANALYTAAEESGVIISGESFARFVDSLKRRLAEEGVDAGLHPRAVAMLERLEKRKAENFTLKGAEIERRNINGVANALDDEGRMGAIMRDSFDDYVNNLKPADTLAGDPKIAFQYLRDARATWKTLKKAEIIDDTIQLAYDSAGTYTGAGFENALRVQFRAVVKRGVRNKRYRSQFTPEEWAMMRKVANGGAIQNVLRWAGKWSIRSPVGGGIGAGVGYVAGGPVGAVAVPVAAEGAKLAAAKMGIGTAERLYDSVVTPPTR